MNKSHFLFSNETLKRKTSLNSRDTRKDYKNASVTETDSVGFQSWCWTVVQIMKSKDQAILELLYVKD